MQRSWRQRLHVWSIPLVLLALAWAVHLLWSAWPELAIDLPRLHVRWLWLTLAGTVLGGYLGFEAFRILVRQLCPLAYGRLALAHLYFTAQLMKHIPGRVWGIAYQSATGRRVALRQWASINVIYMVLTTGVALWVASTVVGCMFGMVWGVMAFTTGLMIYFGAWHSSRIDTLLNLVRRVPLHVCERMADALQPFAEVGTRFKWCLLLWFGASWLVYLLAWGGLGLAWPGSSFADGVFLCALYTVAWFVGYISLVSPSGVGVRELVFVLLAHRFSPDMVAVMAVLGRAMLLTVDVLLGVIFAGARPTAMPRD